MNTTTKKITKKAKLEFLRSKLANDSHWAIRALMLVFSKQTEAERVANVTSVLNGVGFTGRDAEFLSSLAKQWRERQAGNGFAAFHAALCRAGSEVCG